MHKTWIEFQNKMFSKNQDKEEIWRKMDRDSEDNRPLANSGSERERERERGERERGEREREREEVEVEVIWKMQI